MRNSTIAAVLLFMAFSVVSQARAQEANTEGASHLYQWTDDSGVVHITDGLGNVPEQYRTKARTIEEKRKSESGQGQQSRTVTSEPAGPTNEEAEASQKAAWRNRIQEWQTRLAQAEDRYHELDQRRTELLMSWGGPAYGPIDNKVKAEQIEQQMKEVQKQIDEARNMLDVVIPEEARKAGVPPGWLRE